MVGSGRPAPTKGLVRRFDESGEERWSAHVALGQRNQMLDVAVDRMGRSHVTGWTRPTLAPTDRAELLYALVSRDGTIVRQSAIARADSHLIGWEVAVSPSGDVFIGGTDRVDVRVPAVRAYAARLSTAGDALEWFTPILVPEGSFNGGIALTPTGRVVQGASEIYDDGLHSIVRVLDGSTGEELSRHGHYNPEAGEEDVHDVAVRGAWQLTTVGGRTLGDGTWRGYVAREPIPR